MMFTPVEPRVFIYCCEYSRIYPLIFQSLYISPQSIIIAQMFCSLKFCDEEAFLMLELIILESCFWNICFTGTITHKPLENADGKSKLPIDRDAAI